MQARTNLSKSHLFQLQSLYSLIKKIDSSWDLRDQKPAFPTVIYLAPVLFLEKMDWLKPRDHLFLK